MPKKSKICSSGRKTSTKPFLVNDSMHTFTQLHYKTYKVVTKFTEESAAVPTLVPLFYRLHMFHLMIPSFQQKGL